MPDALDTFLAQHALLPWSWGRVDCAMALADWAVANGHPDPFAAWREAYDSEDGWRAIVTPRGGMLPLVADACARAGFAGILEPARGTIAVIGSLVSPVRQWGALHDGARWQVRSLDGFVAVAARPLAMWSV